MADHGGREREETGQCPEDQAGDDQRRERQVLTDHGLVAPGQAEGVHQLLEVVGHEGDVGRVAREKGTSLNSDSLGPKPLASSVYVRVPEASCPHKRSISVTSLFPSPVPFSLSGVMNFVQKSRSGRVFLPRGSMAWASSFSGVEQAALQSGVQSHREVPGR